MELSLSGNIIISSLFLLSGTLLLYFGAEGLVNGSVSVAYKAGITPLVIGLTVVAFGTSSPELVVSLSAASKGGDGIALGNIVGSNICNIALILGVAALIRPIKVSLKLIKTDISLVLFVSVLMIYLVVDEITIGDGQFDIDGDLSRIDGLILIIGIILYNVITIYMARRANVKDGQFEEAIPNRERKMWVNLLLIAGGMGILVIGADLFLRGAIEIARVLGASDAVIGLTVVAFGTSLPELATSIVAAIKNEGDISIGNAIGSNIFNILLILGLTAFIFPIMGPGIESIDLGVMLFMTILLVPLARIGYDISRWDGAILLAIYFGYIYYQYTLLPG